MRRRWLLVFGLFVLLLLAAVLTLPWWLGAAVRPLAARYGATYRRYQTIGYGRFALEDVAVHRAGVTVTVARIEAETPLLWGWRHVRGEAGPVVAGAWSVDVAKRPPTPPTGPSGWIPLRAKLQHIASVLDRWLPVATVGPGLVRWPTGEIRLAGAQLQNRTLVVSALRFRALQLDGKVAFAGHDDLIAVSGVDRTDGAAATLESRGADITGTAAWWNQPATLAAHFAPQGWLPPQATIDAPAVALPAGRLKLSAAYTQVSGRVHAEWRTDHFLADVALHGAPLAGKPAPPLDLTARGQGDAQAFTIEALHAVLPGGTADLTAPVTVERSGRLRDTAARFTVRMDLARQSWFPARGVVTGDARINSTGTKAPGVAFQLAADGLEIHDASLRRIEVAGRLDWPVLQVDHAVVTAPSGEQVQAHGGWDFRAKQVLDTALTGSLSRATLGRWIPSTVNFNTVTVDLQLAGPVADLNHGGRVHATAIEVSSLKPGDATVTWRGRGSAIEQFSADARIGSGRLTAAGAASASDVRLTELNFFDRDQPALRLAQPARIAWHPGLAVEDLHLVGTDASIATNLLWGTTGKVELTVHGFRSAWLADLMPVRGPAWAIPSFALKGSWSGAPMTYSAAGGVTFDLPDRRVGSVNLAAHGGPDGLWIEALHGVESGNPVVNASGRIPIAFAPGHAPLVNIASAGTLAFDASTVPNAAFWQQLAALTGVELLQPQLTAHLTGTWAQPRGTIVFRADHAAMDPKRFARPMPSIDAVDVALTGTAEGVQLDRFTFTIERQLVRATGLLPLSRTAWRELQADPLTYVRTRARLRLEIPDAEVAMFSRFLPAALAPAGRLQADVRFDRGTLGGYLRLRDAASRPLGPLGVLQQVSADVEFSDHQVNLRRVVATSGGQPVTVSGSVELPGGSWNGRELTPPKYAIALKGDNLPFVRQAGLLVRGDLNLKLQTPAKGPPAITGSVVLRDSLFLTDVRAYLPHGAGASPSRRPPYFAIETAPLDTWTLDVGVTGTRFMRVRMPVFSGVASTRFHLGGTLGAPRAIGDATIDEGQVLMPFASFSVTQGAVRLTEESPYEPNIYLRGTGRHYGYDLTMEVTGKASAPNIVFTSSPALDSEQVLLMVMTGAAPSNDVNTSLTHRAVQIGAFFGQSFMGSLMGGSADPDRLSIESGEKISREGKETYSIEYRLTNRWSLTGEYDEFDEYNAGLKWRVAPKKKR